LPFVNQVSALCAQLILPQKTKFGQGQEKRPGIPALHSNTYLLNIQINTATPRATSATPAMMMIFTSPAPDPGPTGWSRASWPAFHCNCACWLLSVAARISYRLGSNSESQPPPPVQGPPSLVISRYWSGP